jgi:hypothetical protein
MKNFEKFFSLKVFFSYEKWFWKEKKGWITNSHLSQHHKLHYSIYEGRLHIGRFPNHDGAFLSHS